MPGFVRTMADEAKWAKGKRAATHAGMPKKSGSWYAFANAFFHGTIKHKDKSKK